MAVLGSPSLTVLTVSVDVKQHLKKRMKPGTLSEFRSCVKVKVAVLVPNSPDGFCGRKATFEEEDDQIKSIFIIHQYTKHKNENFPLTHGLKAQEGTFKITIK